MVSVTPIPITADLVKTLIAQQFPHYSSLEIKPVEISGIDNRTFHLGDERLVRLPSAKGYAPQVLKEQKWLPILNQHLGLQASPTKRARSLQIPSPLHLGKPSSDFHWHWSIYRFLPGKSLNILTLTPPEMCEIAYDLAHFIKKLHRVPTHGGPPGGAHNYYRGCHLSAYDQETRSDIKALKELIESTKALKLWEKTLKSKWRQDPVWVHGDMAIGNLLIHNNRLSAVIDFGCMGVGDPACDLVIAWTFFKNDSRQIFKDEINLSAETWERAKGWALWKACFELSKLANKFSPKALQKIALIDELVE